MTDEGERGGAENATTGEEPVGSGGAPSSEKPGLVRLKWLKINKYRNVRPTTLRFDDGANLVLGLNGSGKTTLLKLLAAVISCQFNLIDEAYDVEYELVSGSVDLRARAWTELAEQSQPSLDSAPVPPGAGLLDASPRPQERRFEATFRRPGAKSSWVLSVEGESALLDKGGPRERQVPPNWRTSGVPIELAVMAALAGGDSTVELGLDAEWRVRTMGLMQTVRRLDESLETLRSLCDPVGDPSLLQCPLVYAFDRSGLAPHFATSGNGNGGFWRALSRTLESVGPSPLSVDLRLAGPMSAVSSQFGLEIAMGVTFLQKHRVGRELAWQWRGLSFAVALSNGLVVTEQALSYGQKRLLTFLYYLAVNDYVVIADELVNGLHHSWIRLCLDQIGQRQAFLTSQNPLLLDYLPPSSVEQAQHQYIECRAEGDELVWENMSKEDAESVMRAYEVGIQQVSEVLEIRGLW